jgi:HEAT repeat protein
MAWEPHRLRCSFAILAAVIWLAAGVAAAGEADQDTINMVIDALKSDDSQMQTGAIAIVRELPGEAVTKALAEQLPDLSAGVQVQLLAALGDRGDASALPAVVEAVKSPDESVRVAALRAVGQLGDASSVPLLAEGAAGARGPEQKAARESLYRLRGEQVDAAILEGIASAEPPVKVELIAAVGQRNISGAIETLLTCARQEDGRVQLESLKVLRTVAKPTDLPVLVNLLLEVKDDPGRTEAEKTVAIVAHRIEDKSRQAVPVLAVLPNVKDSADRASLLRVLGRIGDNSALPTLQTALTSRETEIQDAAVRALADWPTAEPMADLLKVAQTADNKVHRVLALRGFVRMLGIESDRPADETVDLYKKAMDLAAEAAEKKQVLSGLASVKSPAALSLAAQYLDDLTLHQEAELAAVKIAQALHGEYPQQTDEVLQKVIAGTKNDELRRQAQELVGPTEADQAPAESQK